MNLVYKLNIPLLETDVFQTEIEYQKINKLNIK